MSGNIKKCLGESDRQVILFYILPFICKDMSLDCTICLVGEYLSLRCVHRLISKNKKHISPVFYLSYLYQ